MILFFRFSFALSQLCFHCVRYHRLAGGFVGGGGGGVGGTQTTQPFLPRIKSEKRALTAERRKRAAEANTKKNSSTPIQSNTPNGGGKAHTEEEKKNVRKNYVIFFTLSFAREPRYIVVILESV